MISEVLSFAARQTQQGGQVALLTITGTTGSSPASPGQVMVVCEDGSTAGTIGGGASEHKLKQRALAALAAGEQVFEFELTHADIGMTCGGSLKGFGNLLGSGTGLAIFGGGHISQYLAKAAALTGFNVNIIEDRPEFEQMFELSPTTHYKICQPEDYESLNILGSSKYAVVCTRGHSTDFAALRYCITKPLKYLGMIGSAAKTQKILGDIRGQGVPGEDIAKVFTPIGLDIASSRPAEIAISILAEILLVKNGGSPAHKSQK